MTEDDKVKYVFRTTAKGRLRNKLKRQDDYFVKDPKALDILEQALLSGDGFIPSRTILKRKTRIPDRTFTRKIKELVKRGYLIPTTVIHDTGLCRAYYAYEDPEACFNFQAEEIVIKSEKVKKIDDIDLCKLSGARIPEWDEWSKITSIHWQYRKQLKNCPNLDLLPSIFVVPVGDFIHQFVQEIDGPEWPDPHGGVRPKWPFNYRGYISPITPILKKYFKEGNFFQEYSPTGMPLGSLVPPKMDLISSDVRVSPAMATFLLETNFPVMVMAKHILGSEDPKKLSKVLSLYKSEKLKLKDILRLYWLLSPGSCRLEQIQNPMELASILDTELSSQKAIHEYLEEQSSTIYPGISAVIPMSEIGKNFINRCGSSSIEEVWEFYFGDDEKRLAHMSILWLGALAHLKLREEDVYGDLYNEFVSNCGIRLGEKIVQEGNEWNKLIEIEDHIRQSIMPRKLREPVDIARKGWIKAIEEFNKNLI